MENVNVLSIIIKVSEIGSKPRSRMVLVVRLHDTYYAPGSTITKSLLVLDIDSRTAAYSRVRTILPRSYYPLSILKKCSKEEASIISISLYWSEESKAASTFGKAR